jgi:hypothetical protein
MQHDEKRPADRRQGRGGEVCRELVALLFLTALLSQARPPLRMICA